MTAANISRSSSRASGAKRYNGALCAKHPENKGERNTKNGNCIICVREKMRIRRAADPEKAKATVRASYLKHREKYLQKAHIRHRLARTGIDEKMYSQIMCLQGGRCPICHCDLQDTHGHADHNHDTKEPRGILCGSCNRAEGMIRRTKLTIAEFCRRLELYLSDPPARKLRQ